MRWDVIVIGSGIGGMTAALALARTGQRVLVLEQHYLPGGWTHSFTLGGHRFSPGVHYLGELHAGGGLRRLFEGLGVARHLTFRELNPDGFEHFRVGDETVSQPAGVDRWRDRLAARFPHEREGVARYLDTVGRLAADLGRVDEHLGFPDVLTLPLRAPTLARWGLRTLSALLDDCVRDPLLRAVLAGPSGDHGLGPSRVSLPVHAAVAAHYLRGAYYPVGGARRIPAAFTKELRRQGSELRVRSRVAAIRVAGGRVTGVELDSGERIDAPVVIANADPAKVYGKLVEERFARREARKARTAEYSTALAAVFCAVEMDLGAMGYDSGNYWYYASPDLDGIYARAAHALPGREAEVLFLTITTLKDPSHGRPGRHVLEMFTFVPWDAFAPWHATPPSDRGPSYEIVKDRLRAAMFAAAERIIPGLARHATFIDVATPLTSEFYCEAHRGAPYGLARTRTQVGPFGFAQRSPVGGLFLCGASTLSHGVAGAAMSGLIAARDALGVTAAASLLGPADGSLTVVADGARERPSREAVAVAR